MNRLELLLQFGLFLCNKKPGYLAAPGSNQTSVNFTPMQRCYPLRSYATKSPFKSVVIPIKRPQTHFFLNQYVLHFLNSGSKMSNGNLCSQCGQMAFDSAMYMKPSGIMNVLGMGYSN